MNDLMTHVESIVRPLRARQSWKLRTRRELLAHLQSSYDEELSHGLDPAAALARAKSRLGDPAALTRQLQQSAPRLDRIFLARLPAPRAFEAWETRAAERLGLAPPALAHVLALRLAAGFFPYAAAIVVARAVERRVYLRALTERPLDTILFNLACVALMIIIWVASARFVATLAAPADRPRLPRLARYAVALLACYTALTFACVTGMGRRPVTPADLARTVAITAGLLLILALAARVLAAHRRPYDEWISIRLAD